jgi:hypothetical protein
MRVLAAACMILALSSVGASATNYCYVSEFPDGSQPVAFTPPLVDQPQITVSGSPAQSAAFGGNTKIIRISCDTTVSAAFGTNPTATVNNMRLPANVPEYFYVLPWADSLFHHSGGITAFRATATFIGEASVSGSAGLTGPFTASITIPSYAYTARVIIMVAGGSFYPAPTVTGTINGNATDVAVSLSNGGNPGSVAVLSATVAPGTTSLSISWTYSAGNYSVLSAGITRSTIRFLPLQLLL